MSNTQLAVRETEFVVAESPAGLGQKEEIAAIQKRIVQMMPGAAEAPADVQWAAAQLAVAHKLNPFNGEIYVMKLGNKKVGNQWVEDWRAHVGVKGLRKLARGQSEFMTEARVMEPSEVQQQRRDSYHDGDIGVELTLWRLDVAERCARISIPYKPVKTYGFWRQNARMNHREKKWMADNIPETWTAQMVAEKRAEINAIKQAFDMQIDVADPALAERTVDELHYEVEKMNRDEALPAERRIEASQYEDGELLWATPQPERKREPAEEAIEGEYSEASDELTEPPFEFDKQFWGQLDDELAEKELAFLGWLREKQQSEGGPATPDEITALYDYIEAAGVEPTGLNAMLDYLICENAQPSAAVYTALVGQPLKKTEASAPKLIASIWQKMRDFEPVAA